MTDSHVMRAWLAELEDAHGRLTPAAVVEAARDPDSPGHQHFEWDDSAAAYEFRLSQARRLLTVRVIVKAASQRSIAVPLYVRDPRCAAAEQGYISVSMTTAPDLRARILDDEFKRIEDLLQRAEELATAFDLLDEVKDTQRRVAAWREHIAQGVHA